MWAEFPVRSPGENRGDRGCWGAPRAASRLQAPAHGHESRIWRILGGRDMSPVRVRLRRAAVEAYLARRNWTKSQLAGRTGIHRSHLSDLLAGRKSAGPHVRQRLLETLDASFDDLFEIVSPKA